MNLKNSKHRYWITLDQFNQEGNQSASMYSQDPPLIPPERFRRPFDFKLANGTYKNCLIVDSGLAQFTQHSMQFMKGVELKLVLQDLSTEFDAYKITHVMKDW